MQIKRFIQTLFFILILCVFAWRTVFAAPAGQDPPPYEYYFPLVYQQYPIPTPTPTVTPTPTKTPTATATSAPVPPAFYTTSWYMTPANVTRTYQMGCDAGQKTVVLPGTQDALIILDYGQPWGDGLQYGTLLLREDGYDLTSTNDITIYTQAFITGYMACSDHVSTVDIGVGTTNYARYVDGVCTSLSWFCTPTKATNHGRAWATMVRNLNNWVNTKGYTSQVAVSGAIDIELAWNYATISTAWANGFDANDNNEVIYYNYGTCDGCPTRLAPNLNPNLVYDWTMSSVHNTAWRLQPAWPIPEIYADNGINARQWAYLSYWGVTQIPPYPKMVFLSAMTQYQACASTDDDLCEYLDNTPQQAWYQLFSEVNYWPSTALSYIPWMTDIDWP